MKGRKYGESLIAMAQKQHILTDKEVGELWRKHLSIHRCDGACECVDINLIRKLVEERTKLYEKVHTRYFGDSPLAQYDALEDFGIDAKEYKKWVSA